jgi:hypothetical protein
LSACLIGGAIALSASAAIAAPDDAEAHFQRGVEAYKDNDFAAALVEFRRAYDLDPRYQVLYDIGEAYFQLQDYANALRTFQMYLYDGGKKINARRRKDVDRDIEKLRRRVAVVTIETKETGVTIAVDDTVVGTTPLAEPVLVSAGRRRVIATLPGRPPVTQVLDVAGGDAPVVTLVIPPSEVQVRVVPLDRSAFVPPIIAWSATGVALTAAVVTGVVALSASSDLKQKLAAFPGDAPAIASAHARTAAFALATDVLGAAALAGTGVAIYLTVRAQRLHSGPPPPTAIVVRPSGVAIAGTF